MTNDDLPELIVDGKQSRMIHLEANPRGHGESSACVEITYQIIEPASKGFNNGNAKIIAYNPVVPSDLPIIEIALQSRDLVKDIGGETADILLTYIIPHTKKIGIEQVKLLEERRAGELFAAGRYAVSSPHQAQQPQGKGLT